MADQQHPGEDAAARALDLAGVSSRGATRPASISRVEEGVNDLFLVGGANDGLAVKFATYSMPSSFRAGVAAYRLLGATTDLPVPTVYGFQPDPDGMPAFVILERLPGAPLSAEREGPPSPAAVRSATSSRRSGRSRPPRRRGSASCDRLGRRLRRRSASLPSTTTAPRCSVATPGSCTGSSLWGGRYTLSTAGTRPGARDTSAAGRNPPKR